MLAVPLWLALLLLTGCGDTSRANELSREADALRSSAVEKFRRSTAAIDGLVRSAAAGQSLPVNQIKSTTQAASQDLNAALAELTLRDGKLGDAEELGVGETYRDYLSLMKQSNDKLTRSLNVALQIPMLLEREQFALAGWDEIKTQTIVSQIYSMQQQIEYSYSESETLRNRAEQLRKDHPGDFE